MIENNSIYYNPQPLESFNSLFNFVIGERGKGKTYYYAKKRVIDRFLNNKFDIGGGNTQGEQFIYLRRYKNELKTLATFFDDIRHEYPEHKLEVKFNTFYCDGQVMGFAIHLSTANMRKSTAYPYVQTIVYDEFILEKGYIRYLPDEVHSFLNFYETVARLRPNVKVFFLGNAVSLTNPYFVYWRIMPTMKKRFTSVKKSQEEGSKGRHLILVEILLEDEEGFRDYKSKTHFGEIVSGSEYDELANNNEFIHDTSDFIEKRPKNSRHLFNLVYGNKLYGVWLSTSGGTFHVSYATDRNSKNVFAITTEDFKPNMFLVDNLSQFRGLVMLKNAFVNGYLMFDNLQIKSSMYDMMKLIGVK